MTDLFRRTSRKRMLLTLFWLASVVFSLALLGFALR